MKIVRKNKIVPNKVKRKCDWTRKKITEFSDNSRRRLKFCLRNFPNLTTVLVLTCPNYISLDASILRKHIECMRKYFYYLGYAGTWVLEFNKNGAPHIHIVLDQEINLEKVRMKWFKLVGSNNIEHFDHGVYCKLITDQNRLASYLSKLNQKTIPEQFKGIGRLWGKFGRNSKIEPETVITGPDEQVISLFGECLECENRQRRTAGYGAREYDGVYGCSSYNTADFLRKHLKTILKC